MLIRQRRRITHSLLPDLPHGSSQSNPDTKNSFFWNALIADLVRQRRSSIAIEALLRMQKLAVPFDSFTLCSALSAAVDAPNISQGEDLGKQIHGFSLKSGWVSSVFVGGAIIDFYRKIKAVDDARKVFDEIPMKNIVCANTLLSGYFESFRWRELVSLVKDVRRDGLEPDEFTLSFVLRSCKEERDCLAGAEAHAYLFRRADRFGGDKVLRSLLVEMYGNCGRMVEARRVFEMEGRMRDVVLWTALLNACSRNGFFSEAAAEFDNMLASGIEPDELAFLAAISACSHAGNVSGGLSYYNSMSRDYGLSPGPETRSCVVGMLCRAGMVEDAMELAKKMKMKMDKKGLGVWVAILSACRGYGNNVSIGDIAAEKALEVDPENVGVYVELSNLYGGAGLWGEIEKVREMLKKKELKKEKGLSSLRFPSMGLTTKYCNSYNNF